MGRITRRTPHLYITTDYPKSRIFRRRRRLPPFWPLPVLFCAVRMYVKLKKGR
jgi:hypothetical protein